MVDLEGMHGSALAGGEVMGFEMMNGNGHGNGFIYCDWVGWEERECGGYGGDNSPTMASLKIYPTSSSSTSSSSSSPARYIEHHVTKLDTLAGIAIRYGVEVADVKRMNGLVSDLQMFARKTLHIPLPGRHPPSPCLSNGHESSGQTSSEQTRCRTRSDFLESFQSLKGTPEHRVSPAMSSLHGYYGVHSGRDSSRGFEMAVYSRRSSSYHEDESFTTPSSLINPPLSHHRRSRSLANGFNTEECKKSEANFSCTPEKLLEENGSGSWFSTITGKGLALRAKVGATNGFPTTLGDVVAENSSGVRKCSSTPSLHNQENGSSSSIWSTSRWSALKPDLQAALANSIFDGLPKPITGRRAKAALD